MKEVGDGGAARVGRGAADGWASPQTPEVCVEENIVHFCVHFRLLLELDLIVTVCVVTQVGVEGGARQSR